LRKAFVMRIGANEIMLLILLALILFGGKHLSGIGQAAGQNIREFREQIHMENE